MKYLFYVIFFVTAVVMFQTARLQGGTAAAGWAVALLFLTAMELNRRDIEKMKKENLAEYLKPVDFITLSKKLEKNHMDFVDLQEKANETKTK